MGFEGTKHLDGVLVGRSGTLVLGLVKLVADSASGSADTVTDAGVWCVALGLLLVGLLRCLSGLALDGFGNVVGGVGDRVGCRRREESQ